MPTFLRAFLLITLIGGSAAAGKASKRAKELYEQGVTNVKTGRYKEAIAAFEKANLLAPSSALFYNIGQTYRLMGDCARARDAYRAYLESTPKAPKRKRVRDLIEEMEACAERPVLVASNDHGVDEDQGVPEDDSAPREPAMAMPMSMRSDAVPERGVKLKAWGISTAAAGLVAGVAGIYYTNKANNAQDELDGFLASGGTWSARYASLEGQRDSAKRNATYLYGAGGALLVTGGLLYYFGWRESLTVTVATQPGGAQIGVAGNF